MGRSSASSCFRIITCSSDSVDRDDLQATDSKESDKRGWSFRKRSAGQRVLNNTVTVGAPSLNKPSSETATVSFQSQPNSASPEKPSLIHSTDEKVDATVSYQSQPNSTSPEKPSLIHSTDEKVDATVSYQSQPNSTSPEKPSLIHSTDEKIELPPQENSKSCDSITAREDDTIVKETPDESTIILIQASIRGFLAQRLLLKHKNVVKLQAAVRGHIVRQRAVGTLRCVQAIIKMQILVRARRARQGSEGEDKRVTYTSIEKLLHNKFAHQLMESTPQTKAINVKCDPSKSDMTWKWLERWMSVSSMSNEETCESGLAAEQQEKEILDPSVSCVKAKHLKPGVEASSGTSENGDNLITYSAEKFDLQANNTTPPSSSHMPEQSQSQSTDESNSRYNISESDPIQNKESDLVLEVEDKSLPGKSETDNEDTLLSSEQPETDANKLSFSSRKSSNPAFIAAHSKFEELSSSTNSDKITSLSNQHNVVEPKVDKCSSVTSVTDQTLESREMEMGENSISHALVDQIGGSECGTELSISSTLDSPDKSEAGVIGSDQALKVSDVNKNVGVETDGKSSILAEDLSYTEQDQPERLDNVDHDHVNGEIDNSINAGDSSQAKDKPDTDRPISVHSEASHPAYKLSSPEASPRSHKTVSESHATPSSQTSVKPKKIRSAKSVDKKSPSNRNSNSGARSSLEQLHKDHKTGKRRNSHIATKPDNVDQEPRDSASSNTVPSYMQATESARAKVVANSSPRSSPDVHEKDIPIKKRHSLPGANGQEGSPRIERSMSQTQQGTKGNGLHSPQDRKWRR